VLLNVKLNIMEQCWSPKP